ncbi:class D sortase [Lysinibacillus telephonicus]|uniref:Class D sortase n=2 Tax=Lysinibacillus telephonicus TaxID=1714840 RepID=A0A431UUN0_9BACI|nr:class D sortase [Lysinibacillus telephonicus]
MEKQDAALEEAVEKVSKSEVSFAKEKEKEEETESEIKNFTAAMNEAFATLEIPKLNRTLPVVEGTDADSLDRGVGHLTKSVFPGQGEQIVLSGHRDTVFRDFNKIEIGDLFIVNMPYGTFTYQIKDTEIVNEDDTTVIRKMGEEVLVVTTCYPFDFLGSATQRFIIYAYPYDKEVS